MLVTDETALQNDATKKASALTIAVLVHVGLAIVFTLIAVTLQQDDDPEIVASIAPVATKTQAKMEKKSVAKQVKQTSAASAASPIARMIRSNSVARIAAPEVTKVSDGPLGLGEGDFGNGFGSGSGGGGMGSGASFFGMKTGNDLVIVIDISGSMVQGSNSRSSYDKLEKEAIKAISALNSTSRFNIIAFAGKAFTFQERLATGTSSNKGNAIEWIRSYSPCLVLPKGVEKGNGALWNTPAGQRHRGTSSNRALKAAFEMKPRTIIYVSDGEPTDAKPPQILEDVAALQKAQSSTVTIHAFAYRAGGGLAFMEDLAKKNGGRFEQIK